MNPTIKSNCEEYRLKDECMVLYPCEHSNKLEEARLELDRYKEAWSQLKRFVEALQDGHENQYAFSNQYIEYIEDEMTQLEDKLY